MNLEDPVRVQPAISEGMSSECLVVWRSEKMGTRTAKSDKRHDLVHRGRLDYADRPAIPFWVDCLDEI